MMSFSHHEATTKPVEATEKGVWAVHKNPDDTDYHITHTPSGFHVASVKDEATAHKVLDKFLNENDEHHNFGSDMKHQDTSDIPKLRELKKHGLRMHTIAKEKQ